MKGIVAMCAGSVLMSSTIMSGAVIADQFESRPNAKRPLMIIRFSKGHEQDKTWKELFPVLKKNRAACDEVWFSNGTGVIPLTEHQKMSNKMAECAKELRKIGIIPSLQIQATIGHSDKVFADFSAKTWGSMVGKNGEQTRYINCPRQPGFITYLKEMCKIYAQWKPGSVWIDDDLRLSYHTPIGPTDGCYCEHCLKTFADETGKLYTRESLLAAVEKDSQLLEKWQNFNIQSLCLVASAIGETFRKYSPETRMGLQHSGHKPRIPIFKALAQASGKRAASRPGGGGYSDHDPYELLYKTGIESYQIHRQPGYELLDQVCAEIENAPRTFTCKTAQGLRIESLLSLACGVDSLSYYVMAPEYETPQWYGREILAPLAKDSESYRDFIKHNQGTRNQGLAGSLIHRVCTGGFPVIGIPFAAFDKQASCIMVTKETVEYFSEQEIEELFKNNVILDGLAVTAIKEKNLSRLIENITVTPVKEAVREYYTNDPINADLDSPFHRTSSNGQFEINIPANINARVIGKYYNYRNELSGISSVLLTRKNGKRLAILGDNGFYVTYISNARVRFLYRVTDWLSEGKLPVIAEEPVQCAIYPRVTADEKLRSVTIVNTVIGKQRPFKLQLRNVPENIQTVQWCIPSQTPVVLQLSRNGNKTLVEIPELSGWEIGWLKI